MKSTSVFMVICLIASICLTMTSCSQGHDNIFDFEQKSDGTLTVTAFFEKNNLKYAYVNIPESYMDHTVTEIGTLVFEANVTMAGVVLPDTIQIIGESAFANCSRLSDITLHEGLTTIGNWAFYNCRAMTSLTLPSTVTDVGENAFNGMTSLITYTGNVAYLPLVPGDNLTSVTLTSKEGDMITDATLRHCPKLTELTYVGSIATWDALPKSDHWLDPLSGDTLVVHCTDGDRLYENISASSSN